MRKAAALVFAILTMTHCRTKTRVDHQRAHVSAAAQLTTLCSVSRLSTWHVKAEAAGDDCRVLYIRTPLIVEDTIIEALHYGRGMYSVKQGGIEKFSKDRAFRGVAYKDASGRIWTFDVTRDEAERLSPCH